MIASRILFSFLTLGIISVAATPATIVVEKRQSESDILSILTNLQGQNNGTLAQITNLVNSGNANDATITPLITELTSSFSTATTSLGSLSPRHSDLQARVDTNSGRSQQDVANAAAPIYRNIAVSLNNLKTRQPELAHLFIELGVDAALNDLLLGLDALLVGVVQLIAALLVDVGSILKGLGFTLTLATLGLGSIL